MSPNTITEKIKSLLTGKHVEEVKDEPKRNPYPNGPVTYKTMTNGQVRRMQARARRRRQERAFREQRRTYLKREAERAALRGMLQAVGIIDYFSSLDVPQSRADRAEKWMVEKYGSRENAIKRYEHLSGEKISA